MTEHHTLSQRLRRHAEMHEYVANADDEQRQWMDDLRAAADIIERIDTARDDRVHSCSYYCDRPACIRAQRDELRDALVTRRIPSDP